MDPSQNTLSMLLSIAPLLIFVIIKALLALIPSNIAKNKGYRQGAWWFYGFFLIVIATIHIALLPDQNEKELPTPQQPTETMTGSVAAEIGKYKDLLDRGAITPEEYERQKDWILKTNGRV